MRGDTSGAADHGAENYLETSVVVLGAIYGLFLLAVIALNVAVL